MFSSMLVRYMFLFIYYNFALVCGFFYIGAYVSMRLCECERGKERRLLVVSIGFWHRTLILDGEKLPY